MERLLRKSMERMREEARQPGSWGVFVFFGLVNVGQAVIFADSALSRLVFLAIAAFSMLIALKFFQASRANQRARTAQSDT